MNLQTYRKNQEAKILKGGPRPVQIMNPLSGHTMDVLYIKKIDKNYYMPLKFGKATNAQMIIYQFGPKKYVSGKALRKGRCGSRG